MRLLLVVALCAGLAPEALALEQAGVSAAVRGHVQRASDVQPVGVQLVSGQPIYLADRISSGPGSGMQIMLLDQTTFTIGPDSFVKIDEFVYDPATNVGKVTASLGKGVFRFVSGRIAEQNPSNMTVKLPVATIGIRGTMVFGRSDENSAVVGLAGAGPDNNTGDKTAGIDIITPEGTAEIRRPGWGAVIERGKPPVMQRLPKSTVAAIFADVAPRDLVNAVAVEASTNVSSASKPADFRTASNGSGQASATGSQNLQSFDFAQGPQELINTLKLQQLAAQIGLFAAPVLTQNDTVTGVSFGATTFADLRTLTTGIGSFSASNVPIFLSPPGNPNAQTGTVIGSFNFNGLINFARETYTLTWTISTTNTIISNGTISVTQNYAGLSGAIGDNFTGFIPCGGAGVTCDAIATLSNSGGIPAKTVQQAARASSGSSTGFGGTTVTRP